MIEPNKINNPLLLSDITFTVIGSLSALTAIVSTLETLQVITILAAVIAITPSSWMILAIITGVVGVIALTAGVILIVKNSSSEKNESIQPSHIPTNTPFIPREINGRFQQAIKNFLEAEDVEDIDEMRQHFIEDFPEIEEILQIIGHFENTNLHSDLVMAFYVFAGIKPVLVIEEASSIETQEIIKQLFTHFSNLKLINSTDGRMYLINETPLTDFDPKRFIDHFDEKYENLEEAVMYAFPNQNYLETDKLLSYLLGFGPTWETYAILPKCQYIYTHENSSIFPDEHYTQYLLHHKTSVFSDEHYFQLGKVIAKRDGLPRTQYIELGKEYNLNISPIDKKSNYKYYKSKNLDAITELHMYHMIDRISYQTEYIQKGMLYRARLLELFDIQRRLVG